VNEHETAGPGLGQHPVRDALLDLLHRDGVITATSAAGELGGSSGLYSFHLRRLAEYGIVEEAPAPRGHVRPWRLADRELADRELTDGERADREAAGTPGGQDSGPVTDAQLSDVARGLEDESYLRWLERRATAPAQWRRDEAFSQVAYLTPEEMAGLASVIRALIAQYRHREARPAARPPGAAPVAVVSRLFPLLEPDGGPPPAS
jgi:hypothetical protein